MYKFLEHAADMGIYGEGNSFEQAFVEGEKAVFDLMVKIGQVEQKKKVKIKAEADDLAALFVEWLNELITAKDVEGLYFSKFEVKIKQKDSKYKLKGKAWGEPFNPEKHTEVNVEVKGATYSGLECGQKEGRYFCQCVVDI